jgi:hypothetical protein
MNPRTQSVVLLAGAIKNRKVSWGPISQPVSTQMELKVQHGMLMLMCELKSGTNKENSFKFALPCTEPIMLYRVFLLAEASPILSEAVMTDFAYSCFPVQEDPEVIAAQERVNQILPPGTLKNALVAIPPGLDEMLLKMKAADAPLHLSVLEQMLDDGKIPFGDGLQKLGIVPTAVRKHREAAVKELIGRYRAPCHEFVASLGGRHDNERCVEVMAMMALDAYLVGVDEDATAVGIGLVNHFEMEATIDSMRSVTELLRGLREGPSEKEDMLSPVCAFLARRFGGSPEKHSQAILPWLRKMTFGHPKTDMSRLDKVAIKK